MFDRLQLYSISPTLLLNFWRRYWNNKLIYLDQKDWINLARAYYHTALGEKYLPVLEKIRIALSDQSVIFPLSSTHFIETGKIKDISRRKRLAQVLLNFEKRKS